VIDRSLQAGSGTYGTPGSAFCALIVPAISLVRSDVCRFDRRVYESNLIPASPAWRKARLPE